MHWLFCLERLAAPGDPVLSDTMSRYLIQRIEENPAIELHYKTEIVGLAGDTHLERITWRDKVGGNTSDHEIRHVFIMAGASPRTEWLKDCVALDNKGFILTGRDLDGTTGTLGWSSTSSLHARNKPSRSLRRRRCSLQ